MRNAHKIMVGKPEKKRSLGTARHRWEDNNKESIVGWSSDHLTMPYQFNRIFGCRVMACW
jgi:hypothetical protein